MTALTDKQYRVYSFIEEYIRRNGFSPSVRNVADYIGISVKAAFDHLGALKKKNKIKWEQRKSRTIRIVA